jgi:intein/homing endonuclease
MEELLMRECHWNSDEINYLKENYKSMTNNEIAIQLDRSKNAVDMKIKRLGLKKSKYIYNHNYFEIIDNEEKAYWLGFIFADGCVTWNKENNSCELSIKIQANDFTHLKKFNKSINGNIDIGFENRICNLNGKPYNACQIRLYSKKIVFDLIKHGVIPNKSLIVEFPKFKSCLMPHFIRGFFDGDGCIAKNNHCNGKSYVRADFTCGSLQFIECLRLYLNENNIKSYIYKKLDKPYRLMIGGMNNCDRFFHYMYDDANIFLDRKYKKKINLYNALNIEQRLLR